MRRTIWIAALIALAAFARAHDTLIAPNAVWKYLDDGSDQATAWRELAFDDSAWSSGPAELGYGDGDEATVVGYGPDPNNKYITTYFRHSFTAPNAASYGSLTLRLVRDDGAVVYLNGTEVARSNMPGSTIGYLTPAVNAVGGADESRWYTYFFAPGLLQTGANVLAVEIHQINGQSSDISLRVELTGNTEPVLTREPYLQLGTPDGVHVRWRTDVATDSRVVYGASPGNLTQTAFVPASTTEHDLAVSGLASDTLYYYAVGYTATLLAGGDAEHRFTTAPATGGARRFRTWVLGDSGTADANAALVRDAYTAFTGTTPTDLWLMLGDNAYTDGTDQEYQSAVFDMYPSTLRRSVLWPTRGNHEMSAGVYYGIFTMPTAGEAGGLASGTEAYYSFDFANVHFVCLDSYGSDRSAGGAMWTWLQADLASTAQEWLIAFWHHPPYTKGSHDSDNSVESAEMRGNFLPLLEDAGVDLVLSGHSHSFERSFLLDGHYDVSTTLTPSMILDAGDGRPSGSGAYDKLDLAHRGAVYCVSGASGKLGGGPLNHPAMYISLNTLGSLVLDVDGGRLDATYVTSTGQVADAFTILHPTYTGTYCKAKLTSQGCLPSISATGTASASSPARYTIAASSVPANKSGLLFYGFGPGHGPFQGGKLCIAPPITRTLGQNSGGTPPCGGQFHYDFNARIQSGIDPALQAGRTVYTQYWFRDPPAVGGTGLSNGQQFVIQP